MHIARRADVWYYNDLNRIESTGASRTRNPAPMNQTPPVKAAKRWLVVILLLVTFFIQSFSSIVGTSATYDEILYFGIGKYLLINQKWDVMGSIVHPPLTYYLNSLPLLFVDEDPKLWQYDTAERDLFFLGASDVLRGQGILMSPEYDGDQILVLSRLMTLLVALLLGFYVYRFGRELYGEQAGLLALLLFTFCPNILALSGNAVPDIPLTAFGFIFIYYLWKCLRETSHRTTLLAGFYLGLALLSKFTALALLPVAALLCLIVAVTERKAVVKPALIICGVASLMLLAGYGFQITPFLQGMEYRIAQVERGHLSFLMGEYSVHGWWYYYPVALLLKTPLAMLALLGAALVMLAKTRGQLLRDSLFLIVPAAVIFLLFCTSSYSVALRYILPIYPFLFVLAGSLIMQVKKFRSVIILMALWYVGASFYIAPHYLAYFNELAGGPDGGYRYLVDGNLDWGQDLKGLKKFMDINGIKRISLSYFGADSPARHGIDYDWLPSYHLEDLHPEREAPPPQEQLLAVSATNLQGTYLQPQDQYAWLRNEKPVAKIGYSIFIYDLSGKNRSYRPNPKF